MTWKSNLASAAAGAVAMAAVYEVSARLSPADAQMPAVESAVVRETEAVVRQPERSAAAMPAPTKTADDRIEELEFQNRVLRGQLDLAGGVVSEWPTDLQPAYRPEGVRSWLTELLDTPDGLNEGIQFVDVDCTEFPCVAIFRYDETLSVSSLHLASVQFAFDAHVGGGALHNSTIADGPDGPLVFIPMGPLEGPAGYGKRLSTRLGELADDELSQ